MDCPECGGKIEIEEWEIWNGIGICLECGKTYSIELKEKEVKKEMSKKIEVFYDVDYGIFTIKTTGLGLSKTKLNQLESRIKREIDNFLKV